MILTLTLNPSLDRAIEVERLTRGTVIRAEAARLDPGGKGVNVSRALLGNGVASTAVVPCGGDEGEQLVRLLRAEGVDVRAVQIAGRTRSNVTIAEPDGTVTKINEPGAPLTPAELDAVAEVVLAAASGRLATASGTTGCHSPAATADWVVVCGSLPPGVPEDTYATLCERFTAAGIRVAVDSSGSALLTTLAAGPALVKPNRDELAEAVGHPVASLQEAVDAAQELRTLGAGAVLASLGADGAVLVDGGGVTVGHAPVPAPRSSVGAGDALLAGFLAAGAQGSAALAEALAWAAAAVGLPGSRMPTSADIRRDTVRIQPAPDLTKPLVVGG